MTMHEGVHTEVLRTNIDVVEATIGDKKTSDEEIDAQLAKNITRYRLLHCLLRVGRLLVYRGNYHETGEPVKHAMTKCIVRVTKPYRALSSAQHYI